MKPAYIGEDPKLALSDVVRLLNEGFDREHPLHAEAHANLLQLIRAWQQADDAPPNAFERRHGPPGAKLPRILRMNLPSGCPSLHEMGNRCRVSFLPFGVAASVTFVYAGEGGEAWTAWDFACQQFIRLITNPAHDKFAGPCARCGKYYVKKRSSQKVYCSRTCGNAATAVVRTREKWDKNRAKRLLKAEKAMLKWSRSKTAEPFQAWAEKRYPGLTKRFLTRAIGNEELPEPRKQRS